MSREIIVKEAMKTNLAIINPELTVLDAATLMKKEKLEMYWLYKINCRLVYLLKVI